MTDAVHKLGEVLRTAREAKSVDLVRVERETKIRERYLSALERGEYRELPGAVYTRGFLRNYGTYLGLDAEYLIDLYRLETSAIEAEPAAQPGPPRPLAIRRRRTFVVTPGAIVAAILTLMVGALVAWFGYEFVNFARTPELRITRPAGNVADHDRTSITIGGITAPNATVTVRGLRENPSVVADGSGAFELTVGLVPGSNVIRLTAFDPVTNRNSAESMRTVEVVVASAASPTPEPTTVTLEAPAADATLTGAVAVAGIAAPEAELTIAADLVTPATPTFAITDGAGTPIPVTAAEPATPAAVAIDADAAGAFSGSIALAPGTWELTVTPDTGSAVTRGMTIVPADGITGTLNLRGGRCYLEVVQDGVPLAGVSGTIVEDGQNVPLAATGEIRILAGNAGAVQVTLNGLSIGPMGGVGAVLEWRIVPTAS